ncbi:PAS domain S-box-containing protein [Halogranum rubrum]|uniref:histidine kinase n=1 Tax=Halogranum rubrum TaxID=553466 RepID=A0A1I4E0B1_9EURY|nr:bacterio-opsin activator domain-containing protein [Halogranum rubrum]SFK97806.1 PAS domain S-box-containing protein [Halogranum rubrum]
MADEQELRDHSGSVEGSRADNEHTLVRVLFVTDEASEQEIPSALGASDRLDVYTVGSDEVLDRLGELDVDCLVSEYRLSEGDGLGVLADVSREYPGLPFVLVTDEIREGLADEALSAGAADVVHLSHSDETALLVHRIRSVVDGQESGRHEKLHRIYHALETTQEGIALLDEDGTFEYVNQAYADLYAYDPEEMLGLHWRAIYPDDEVDRVADEILPSVDEGGYWSGETTGLRADGTTFDEQHSLSKTADDGLICTVRDVTEQKRQRELVDYYRSVVEDVFGESDVGVFIVDSSGRVAWTNRTTERYFGLEETPVEGRSMDELVDESLKPQVADPAAFAEGVAAASEDDTSADDEFEVRVLPKSGRAERFLEHRSQPIQSGEYAGGRLELYYDVSERKQREQALRETEERLEAAMTVGSVGTWVWDVTENDVVGDAALADLFGIEPELAQEGISLETFLQSIHEDDRDRTATAIQRALDTGNEFETEYRVYNSEGAIRWVLARGEVEYDDGEPVRFSGALTDITERKRTEGQLEETAARLERSNERLRTLNDLSTLVQDITQTLIARGDREGIERAVCEALVGSDLYTAASIGEVAPEDGTGTLRASVTKHGTFEDSHTVTALESEAAMRAIRTGAVQVVREIDESDESDESAAWLTQARDHGDRSAVMVPIGYEETSYGVLTLYTTRTNPCHTQERTVVRRLGEVIGHAINGVETKQRLFADTVVELEFSSADPTFFFNTVSAELDCTVRLNDTVRNRDGDFVYYVTVETGAVDDVRAVFDRMDAVNGARLVSEDSDDECVFEISITGKSIGRTLAEQDAKITTAVSEQGTTRLTTTIGPQSDVRTVVDAINARYANTEFTARRETTRSDPEVRNVFDENLTDKQRSAVQAAYHSGFYSWPRESTGEDVAESLGISAPTYHQHLRAAHRAILSELVEGDDEERPDDETE